ncbi:MAG: RNA polymerase factor sigma-54 [Deltaproteobacteria bacterium]|nr:RNA polymerase factor sigma-54 [Deltaproteobacteria bacterium]MBN2671171.1 RNA polymerase factor sigma-54 [Deltaproteobacteria bacterium]
MAGIELKQQLKLQQQLVMTPQLQQAIKLLQLSRVELVDMVRTELEENPVLEENLESSNRDFDRMSENEAPEPTVQVTSEPSSEEAIEGSKEIDWEKYLENYANQPPTNSIRNTAAEDGPSLEATLGSKTTLTDHLLWQLHMTLVTEEEERFIEMVIGSLDKDGYLKETLIEELAEEAGLDPEDAEEVLKIVHGFDPVGVGARDLRECLLAQVDALELDIDVRTVVENHLEDLERRNYKAIAKALELELEDVYEVAKIISNLEPKPARNFITEDPRYITPDVYVHKIGDRYFVVPNDDGLPRLKIAGFFKNAMDHGDDAKEYVQNKMRSAQWLIRSIDQRRRTITKVTECIVEKQQDFFEKGVNHLRPLILRDVAEAVGMHESTISRVTTNKYIQTPQGLFELKYFFNSSIKRTTEDDIASESVKNKIKEIVDGENSRKPFSDQKIVHILKDNGIVIARRTVAKYREMLGILSSTKRKKLF